MDWVMGRHCRPVYGYTQPTNGQNQNLRYSVMATGKKGKKTYSAQARRLHAILAENTLLLMDRAYPIAKYKTRSAQLKELASDSRCSFSSTQRLLDTKEPIGTGIDMVANIAATLGVLPAQLLTNGFAAAHLREGAPASQEELQRRRSGRTAGTADG